MAEQLLGAMAVLNGYAPALRFIADGPIIVDPLSAHGLTLSDYPHALEMVCAGEGRKIQIAHNR
jgi:hypothetical protein